MTLDATVAELLAAVERAGIPRVETLSPEEAREMFVSSRAASALPAPERVSTRDVEISTETGSIPGRIYTPPCPDAPLAGLVFIHGGGWVIGDISSYDDICAALASRAGCCVMSVGYRRAPEHKFPAALLDAAASLCWLVQNSAVCNVDPERVGVAGDSAGANLAAVLAIMSRDGDLPRLLSQILLYPVTDLSLCMPSHSEVMPLARFTSATMRWFRDHYLRTPDDITDWRASPLVVGDLRGVAPVFLLTAGVDPLRDDGYAYAERLRRSGVEVQHDHYPDQVHAFINFGKLLPAASDALDRISAHVAGALAPDAS